MKIVKHYWFIAIALITMISFGTDIQAATKDKINCRL